MKTMRGFSGLIGAVVGLAMIGMAGSANAVPIGFNISWTGSDGYSMTGMFSYDSSLTGPIDETQIDSFMIEVFQGAVSQGAWDFFSDPVHGTFNFNFDTDTESFIVGGDGPGPAGQLWNTTLGLGCPSFVGFISDEFTQAVCVPPDMGFGPIPVESSTLSAARKDIPEPSTLALFLMGLVAVWLFSFRRSGSQCRAKAQPFP